MFTIDLDGVLREMAVSKVGVNVSNIGHVVVTLDHVAALTKNFYDATKAEAIDQWLEIMAKQGHTPATLGFPDREALVAALTVEIEPKRFNARDRKAVASKKVHEIVEKYLSDSPWAFNIVFDDTEPNKEELLAAGYQLDGHITFVKGSSSGDILTPHMILHCIGHAVFSIQQEKLERIDGEINHFTESVGLRHNSSLTTICQFLHFKSAKALFGGGSGTKVTDMDEVIYDMFAIFLRNNAIKIAPNEYYRGNNIPAGVLNSLRRGIQNTFINALDHCVGRIVYD